MAAHREGGRFSWLDAIGLAAASAPVWIASFACLVAGRREQWSDALAGGVPGNLTRNLFELLYFVAGVAVAVIALVAIVFARRQAEEASNSRREAEQVRLSTVYMTIVDRWNARDLVEARLKLFALVDEYDALPARTRTTVSVGGYVRDRIMALKGADWRSFREYIVLLQFSRTSACCAGKATSTRMTCSISSGKPLRRSFGISGRTSRPPEH